MSRSRPCLAEPPAESPSTMKSSRLLGVRAVAVVELAGEVQAVGDRRLAADLAGGGAAGLPGPGRLDHPVGDRVADALVLQEEPFEGRPHGRLDERADLGVVQSVLRLALELRLVEADREHGDHALADVFLLDFHPFLDQFVSVHELADGRADGLAEALLVGAAVPGGDRVDEGADVLVGGLGPAEREVHAEVVLVAFEDERLGGDPLVVPRPVDGVEEIGHATVVAELGRGLPLLVDELDHQPFIQVSFHVQAFGDQRGVEGLVAEDLGVGRKGDGGAGAPGGLAGLDAPERLAPAVVLGVGPAVAADLGHERLAQRVDDAGADAVEAAGHLVGVVVELAAGVEGREDDLQGALAGLRVLVDGDAAAVVGDGGGPAVGPEGDDDPRGVAVHDLVHGVVHDLPEEVVEARLVHPADVHPGAAADGLQALQDRDRIGVIRARGHQGRPRSGGRCEIGSRRLRRHPRRPGRGGP